MCADVAAQIGRGSRDVFGVMVESHLKAGKQTLTPGKPLVYGRECSSNGTVFRDDLPPPTHN